MQPNLGDALLRPPIEMQRQYGARPKHKTVVTDSQRITIRRYLREGFRHGAIAMTLGLSVNAIKNITIND